MRSPCKCESPLADVDKLPHKGKLGVMVPPTPASVGGATAARTKGGGAAVVMGYAMVMDMMAPGPARELERIPTPPKADFL
jgi:hypothetical protein